ncbi:MAG: S9 family peptidase [Ignavibacteria bacterium]|nr:MAG: S9 family peptidase [Ignavibacteria bacterium]
MKRLFTGASVVVLLSLVFISCAPKEEALIPRADLFGNPEKASLRISPDGAYISYLAPVEGVLNVWIAPADNPTDAKAVSKDTYRGIRTHFWSYTGKHLLYLQDEGGDENMMLHCVNVETGEDVNLTPYDEILDAEGNPIMLPSGKKMRPRTQIQELSPETPEVILVGLNKRDPQWFDLYRLNILSGEMEMVQMNEGFAGFVTDESYAVRFASKMTPDGGTAYFVPDGDGWKPYMEVSAEDLMTTGIMGFNKDGSTLYMRDSRGRNTAALFAINMETGESTELASHDKADVSGIISHPATHEVQAVSANYDRISWQVLDDDIQPDLDYLNSLVDGELSITSRTLDDKHWTVAFITDDGPVRYYLYDREARNAEFLFTNRASLENLPLSKMNPMLIPTRDDLELVCYLTLPSWMDSDNDGRPTEAVPMVLFVHGGPWARDSWGYNPYHQWLANRGYAVLSVNYRGSTGFGKHFVNASNLEWAGKMHDDLLDAVDWAIDEGITTKENVAIMGGSYGGYATLVGLTFTPDVFVCGVDIVGPSNLRTLLETIPPYWKPMMDLWAGRVGDPRTEEGRAFLDERSPLTFVDRITKPLLIGQGANDPRVKQSESDQIVKAMQEKNIPVTYVLYPDEGHGFARPENRLSFNAVTEIFLAQHLGGRFEAIGTDFTNSSIQVPEGATIVPGLAEALPE